MSAVVAGISEEAGFRGYMQKPLEQRYGPASAIVITSIVFALAHLTHGTFVPAILFDFGWGALYGLLAYWSGSIVPGIILHSSADALGFIAAWKLTPQNPVSTARSSGLDALLWEQCLGFLLLGAAAVWAFWRLRRLHSFPASPRKRESRSYPTAASH